jgi:hypothetical protein
MIWRTAVAPGWGHLYADQWRGWIYMPLWAGSLGTFIVGVIDYAVKDEIYQNATSGLESAYAERADAKLVRNVAFVSVLGVYTITIADILIFGKKYEKIPVLSDSFPVKFYAFVLPGANTSGYNSTGDLYVQFGAQTKF